MDEKNLEAFNKSELIINFEKIITKSDYLILSFKDLNDTLSNFYSLTIQKDKKIFNLTFNIRNISDAYLPNKPYIKRRQVGKLDFDSLPLNNKTNVTLLLGLKEINGELVLVCWNPFYFVGHQTNRSCYVLESTMEKALQCGFYIGEDCKTKLYVCNETNFGKLLTQYIEENAVE